MPSSVKTADVQTISFSTTITNPVLLVNFADADSTMNFGAQSITVLQTHNAQFAGGVFTFTGATNSFDDGFAARINGTFGPGTPITFDYVTAGTSLRNPGSTAWVSRSARPPPSRNPRRLSWRGPGR